MYFSFFYFKLELFFFLRSLTDCPIKVVSRCVCLLQNQKCLFACLRPSRSPRWFCFHTEVEDVSKNGNLNVYFRLAREQSGFLQTIGNVFKNVHVVLVQVKVLLRKTELVWLGQIIEITRNHNLNFGPFHE